MKEDSVDISRESVIAAVGKKAEVVDLLDRHLGENDHAWVVCDYDDCLHFVHGRCTIYMIHNVPKMLPGKRCNSFQKRP